MKASHSIMLTAIYVMTVAIFSVQMGAAEWGLWLVGAAWIACIISSACAWFEWRDGE